MGAIPIIGKRTERRGGGGGCRGVWVFTPTEDVKSERLTTEARRFLGDINVLTPDGGDESEAGVMVD